LHYFLLKPGVGWAGDAEGKRQFIIDVEERVDRTMASVARKEDVPELASLISLLAALGQSKHLE
jgi:hypothetical protein